MAEGFPRQAERPWPDAWTGPYTVRLTFDLIDGRPEVVGVEMWGTEPVALSGRPPRSPDGPPAPIRNADVRLPLGRFLKEWQATILRSAEIAEFVESLPEQERSHPPGYAGRIAKVANLLQEQPPRRRRGTHDRDHWEKVASIYLKTGTKGVGEAFNVSAGTAGKWVSIARNREGLLPPTTRGVATGRTKKRRPTKRRTK